jgi:hypothetical protein
MQQQQLPSWRKIVRSRTSAPFLKSMEWVVVEWTHHSAKSRPRGTRGIFKKLEPRLEEAKSGQRAVFFVDAAHFVLGAYLFVCFERLFVKSGAGRQRFNVLGAPILSPMNYSLWLMTPISMLNQFVTYFINLRPSLAIPITLFWIMLVIKSVL